MEENKKINRREFFRTCGRAAIAGGLTAFAALMWKRNKGRKLSNQQCLNQGICGRCGSFDKCKLPQALSAKKFIKKS